jgi:SAM-dependent methyltransferase
LETLPFPDGFFNGVLCLGVIEYLPNIDVGIEELSRITKPGGFVIISMLNEASPYRFWREKVYRSHRINGIRKRLKRPVVPDSLLHNVLSKQQLECKLAGYRLQVTDFVYYDFNLLLAPLDRFFPKLAVNIARRLEFLGRTRFANMGSGFIVKSIKMQN